MTTKVSKAQRVDAAIERINVFLDCGHLLALTDQAAWCEAVADRLEAALAVAPKEALLFASQHSAPRTEQPAAEPDAVSKVREVIAEMRAASAEWRAPNVFDWADRIEAALSGSKP